MLHPASQEHLTAQEKGTSSEEYLEVSQVKVPCPTQHTTSAVPVRVPVTGSHARLWRERNIAIPLPSICCTCKFPLHSHRFPPTTLTPNLASCDILTIFQSLAIPYALPATASLVPRRPSEFTAPRCPVARQPFEQLHLLPLHLKRLTPNTSLTPSEPANLPANTHHVHRVQFEENQITLREYEWPYASRPQPQTSPDD